MAPLCWANTAKSHLGRIHLTRHRHPQQGHWANHRQFLSQPAKRNQHFLSTTSRPILDISLKMRWIMPWTPSAALARSLQTLQEPRVTTAEVSIYAVDASLMRWVPSAPTERLQSFRKADNRMASKKELYLHFWMWNPCSLPRLMTLVALELVCWREEQKGEHVAETCAACTLSKLHFQCESWEMTDHELCLPFKT